MSILIHNKEYVTVDERVKEAHENCKAISIITEVLPVPDKIVIKATVTTPKGTFTGISAANEAKLEKQSPYEVAETSAVGRALGFAGYGVINGIATADEVVKAQGAAGGSAGPATPLEQTLNENAHYCSMHKTALKNRGRDIWDHRGQGELVKGELIKNAQGSWFHCQGAGWHSSANQRLQVSRSI